MSLHKEVIHWGLLLRKRGISVHISQRYERGGTKMPVWSRGQSPASHFCTTQSTEDLLLRNGKGLLIGGRMWIPADGREAQPSLSVRFTKPCVLPIQLWTLQCLTTCWSVFTCPLSVLWEKHSGLLFLCCLRSLSCSQMLKKMLGDSSVK